MKTYLPRLSTRGLADMLRNHQHTGGIWVCENPKAIMMKITKSAGTSMVRHALPKRTGPWMSKVKDGARYQVWLRDITDIDLTNYTIFAFVRNPWSRFLSVCAYYGYDVDDVVDNWGIFQDMSDFRDHTLPQHYHTHYRDKRFANFIGRFENLQEDYNHLCDVLGIERHELPHINSSTHGEYRDELDDNARWFVELIYQNDIELYGYKW